MSTFLTGLDDIREPNGPAVAKISSLDSMLAAHKIGGPYGIKTDTEGYEPEVLTDAGATLADTGFVIAEISLVKRF
ncbi:FkbM family methyltransferase [Hyphomicrobium sp.]|uniref:FkbM family methyltransferase n=1 Tax=Hyphomicrobium sp. TaxID=82 RepID=UPI002FE3559D